MSDDWRLRIDLADHGSARRLGGLLGEDALEHDLDQGFHDRVVVSVSDETVFCYTGSREQADRARSVIEAVAGREQWQPRFSLARWHPVAEEWEDPDAPLPGAGGDAAQEREERVEGEREESAEQGYPDFEVRVTCSSRHDAVHLAQRLESEGIPHLHRWSYLLIGAVDEQSAQSLADRLRAEAPADAKVTVEGNARAVLDSRPASPFAILGGLGG